MGITGERAFFRTAALFLEYRYETLNTEKPWRESGTWGEIDCWVELKMICEREREKRNEQH